MKHSDRTRCIGYGFVLIAKADIVGQLPGKPLLAKQIGRHKCVLFDCLFQRGIGLLAGAIAPKRQQSARIHPFGHCIVFVLIQQLRKRGVADIG